jgi:small-conductance mechanosensitive channel
MPQIAQRGKESGMTGLWNWVTEHVGEYTGLSESAIAKIISTIVLIVIIALVRLLITRLTARRVQDLGKRYIAAKAARYLLGIVMIVGVLRIWVGGLSGFVTYLGIVSAGIAIALQDPVVGLVGWLYIIVRKPFTTGDRIQIGEHSGDVIDISLFQFSMVEIGNWVDADQSTGRIIHVPNGWVFKHSTCNYTQGFDFIWNEMPVTVTFESNWERAKEILLRIATDHSAIKSDHAANQIRKAAHRFMIFFQHLTPIVWTSVADSGVTLTMRYLCTPRGRRTSAAKIWEAVLREFAKCEDVDLAYPTTRMIRNHEEGKPALRAPKE